MKGAQLNVTHVGLTAAEGCIVTAAVAVLAAQCVAVALVLRVVLLTAPALTRQRSLWERGKGLIEKQELHELN